MAAQKSYKKYQIYGVYNFMPSWSRAENIISSFQQ